MSEALKWPNAYFGLRRKRSTPATPNDKIQDSSTVDVLCGDDVTDESRDLKYQVSLLGLSYIDLWLKLADEDQEECLTR